MHARGQVRWYGLAACMLSAACVNAQPPAGPGQSETVRRGQQLMRQGQTEQALALFRQELAATPNSVPANTAAGIALDLLGRGAEARTYFAKAIEAAATPQARANAQRAMAMSYAFEGDCRNTVRYEQQVFDYYVATKNYYQQGEMADEAARVCIDSGDLDTAYQWYQKGHQAGLQEPDIQPDRKDLWDFRWEHAQARIAARRGNLAEARKHVQAARKILDKDPEMAKAQEIFFPYLTGYVAFYSGDYRTALADLEHANARDPFIQCLIAQTYEKLGDSAKAAEYFQKAAAATAHNPPAAYAHRVAKRRG